MFGFKQLFMKNILIIIVLFVSVFGFAQEKDKVSVLSKKDEIKGNALFLVAGALEVTYERILNEESGTGVSLFIPYDNTTGTKFNITSFYRFYFGKKPAAGFYAEGFGMLNSYTQEASNGNLFSFYNGPEKDVTDLALGFGIGGKWITKKGFIFEINSGIGRNLFNSKSTDYLVVGRGGVTLGYRF